MLGAGLVCVLCLVLLPPRAASDFSDVAQLVAALAASIAAGRHVRRGRDRRTRCSWLLVSLACASWAAGEAYWCSYSLDSDGVPFPSLADVGFLGFSLLMAAGLAVHPAGGGRTGRLQRVLDGLLTAGAVGLVGWLTSLGAVAASDGGSSRLVHLLLLAYPSTDVLLIVLVVLSLSRSGASRTALCLVSAGVLALGVSDSAFAYLGATGLYDGGLIDLGWLGGFLLIALAGTCASPPPAEGAASRDPVPSTTVSASVLPYVPVVAALVTVAAVTLFDRPLAKAEMMTACLVVLCLLARQYLALRDNRRLAGDLAAREHELRRQALHDPLTGSANRLLFRDRLEHVLELHTRDGRPAAVVFLDLDDFKTVNDTHGHAAGDELLVQVARRICDATRAGDTVARLGGDEFAVLLEDAEDPMRTAQRIHEALAAPLVLPGGTVHRARASIGVAVVDPGDPAVSADELLVRADTAMYAAKRAGKGTVVPHDRVAAGAANG